MAQNIVKKEGKKFGARCSEDNKNIVIFNRATDEETAIQDCGEMECQLIGEIPQCVAQDEVVKELESTPNYLPYLLITGIIFVFMLRRGGKAK